MRWGGKFTAAGWSGHAMGTITGSEDPALKAQVLQVIQEEMAVVNDLSVDTARLSNSISQRLGVQVSVMNVSPDSESLARMKAELEARKATPPVEGGMDWECHNCGHHHNTLPARCEQCGTAPEIVLNRWRCQHCGHEDIPGTDATCPVCKAAKALQGESRVDTSSRLEGDQALALARGSWRYCAYCDVQVPPVNAQGQPNEACPQCRGPLSEAEAEAAVQEVSAEQAGQYMTDQVQQMGAPPQAPAPGPAPGPAPVPPRKSRTGCLIAAGVVGGGLALLVVLVIVLATFTRKKNYTVDTQKWARTIKVEEYGLVAKEAWRSALPGDARDRVCRRKIHHHDKVADGKETYKDKVSTGKTCAAYGYKKKGGVSVKTCKRWKKTYKTVTRTRTRYRKVPRYRQYCRYKVRRWHVVRELNASGTGAEEPKWPSTDELKEKQERAGAKSEKYTLVLKQKGEKSVSYECKSQSEWRKYPEGKKVEVETSLSGKIKKIAVAE